MKKTILILLLILLKVNSFKAQTIIKYYYNEVNTSCSVLDNPLSIRSLDELTGEDTLLYSYRITFLGDKIIAYDTKLFENSCFECTDYKYRFYLSKNGNYDYGIDYSYGVDTVFYESNEVGLIEKAYSKFKIKYFKYSLEGKIIEISTFDNKGFLLKENPIMRLKYDSIGNNYEIANFDQNNKLSNSKYDKISIQRIQYDNIGRIVEKAYFDKEDALISGVAIYRYKYDMYGNLIENSYYDKNNILTSFSQTDFVAIQKMKFNDIRKVIEETKYSKDGYLIEKTERLFTNNKLKEVKVSYYEYNNLRDGMSVSINKFDTLGYSYELSNYNKNNELINDIAEVAIYRYTNDNKGNVLETSNFDKNSELTNDFAGVAIYRTKFDNSGILIESANFDKNSDLTNDFAGVAIYRYKYDMFGNLIEYAKFNNNDQLIEGIAVTKYKYNSARQIIEQMYFNESEVLIDGVAIERKAYDLGGNIIEISNYNKMNELTNSNYNSDAAIIRYKYDENNMIIEEAYYDTENNLTISYNLDVAIIRYKYDENNIKIEEAYYDTENNLTNSSTINLGSCAIIRFNQDSLFEEKGFNIYNEQVKSIFYNNQYKLIQETYYKGNSMINDQNGIAKYIYFYDLDGMRIQEDQFDKNQNFVVRIKYTYEGYILSTIEYFDLKNQLSISKEGYSKIDLINKIYFNKKGKVIKPEQLLNSKVTYVKSYGIDINGDTIYLKFFSIKGKPINGEEGYYYYDYINNKYYNYKGKEVFYNIETSVYN